MVCNVPGEPISIVPRQRERESTYQKCQRFLYHAHSSAVFVPHVDMRMPVSTTGDESHAALMAR